MINLTSIKKEVDKLDFTAIKFINSLKSGNQRSFFKHNGLEFNSLREYQEQDDARYIDWNTTARFDKPYVQQFTHDSNFNILIMMDLSASMLLNPKIRHYAGILTAIIAHLAEKEKGKSSYLMFSDRIEYYQPPNKGTHHIKKMLREHLNFTTTGKKTDYKKAFNHLNKILKKRHVVFIISDFLWSNQEAITTLLNPGHEWIALHLKTPDFNNNYPIFAKDIETGETGFINNTVKSVDTIKNSFTKNGSWLTMSLEEPPQQQLKTFFKNRKKR